MSDQRQMGQYYHQLQQGRPSTPYQPYHHRERQDWPQSMPYSGRTCSSFRGRSRGFQGDQKSGRGFGHGQPMDTSRSQSRERGVEFRRGGRGRGYRGGRVVDYGTYGDYMQSEEKESGETTPTPETSIPPRGRRRRRRRRKPKSTSEEKQEAAEGGTQSGEEVSDEEDSEANLVVATTPEALAQLGVTVSKNWKPRLVSKGFVSERANILSRLRVLRQYRDITQTERAQTTAQNTSINRTL
ncbi:MAG: hypothetical protein GY820_09835, partial [Gammaproteobacteria bacterium]|nr:hypothetical protein [Gammaproteobacteria bacterium]